MNYTMLKGKIHRAVVKQADLNYVGSITVDTKLLEAAGILEYEMVRLSMWKTETDSRPTPSQESRAQA